MSERPSQTHRDVVAKWVLPLSDGIYTVEFEHGTASGMRAIFVNGKCIKREEFKFLLIGEEHFKVGSAKCTVQIKTLNSLEYGYSLVVNGLQFEDFLANQARQLKCWILPIEGVSVRVVLQLDTLEIYSNGEKLDCTGEFTDDGSETHFVFNGTPCFVRVTSSGHRKSGMSHTLFVGNKIVTEAAVDQLQTWEAYWG